jgi:transcriptional regulator with XRE-family HTH domain
MAKLFGGLLRDARESAGKSMGQLARHLDVTVPYLSDVERGNRPPLVDARIVAAATFLNTDPEPLLKAAAGARNAFQLNATNMSPEERQVGAMLARQWNEKQLSQTKIDKLLQLLKEIE